MTSYIAADGTERTTCGQHRILGYAFAADGMVCRGCGERADRHESNDETVARKAAEL